MSALMFDALLWFGVPTVALGSCWLLQRRALFVADALDPGRGHTVKENDR